MRSIRSPLAFTVLATLAVACGGTSGHSGSPPPLAVPVGASPQRGPADAWVTLIEFTDFQCPYCRAEEPIVRDLLASYGPDLRLVFKHLPLSFHLDAQPAAIAAECAGEQGFFWEMHDLLITTALDEATLVADAAAVPGLDVTAWQACRVTPGPAARIAEDVALASSIAVPGTPTFVVNGVEIVGAVPEADLRAEIDRARAAAVASGIPRAEYYDRAVLGK